MDMKEEVSEAFKQSRDAEMEGQIENGTFRPIHISKIPIVNRIFGSRFVDQLKRMAKGTKHKSRLVAQNDLDKEAAVISTKTPTVKYLHNLSSFPSPQVCRI